MARGAVKRTSPTNKMATKTNHLLLIGIDEYQTLPTLENAVKDALDISNILTQRYSFSKKNIYQIIDKAATGEKIESTLMQLTQELSKEDNLLIYFSGHGIFDEQLEEGYWLPCDAIANKKSTFISNANLVTYLNAIKTHHTVVISDSCFSGSLLSKSRGTKSHISENFKFPSRWILTSGRKEEPVSDGRPGSNSPFTKSLLKNLIERDSPVGLKELSVLIEKDLSTVASQNPLCGHLDIKGNDWGEFVFIPKGIPSKKTTPTLQEEELDPKSGLQALPNNILAWQQQIVAKVGFWPWMFFKWVAVLLVLFYLFYFVAFPLIK